MEAFELPNKDIYHNVLSWLPIKVLLRFKCVCKEWCGLIYDRFFRRVQSQKTRREPISGFFYLKTKFPEHDSNFIAYIPVEQHSTGWYQRPDFSFLPEDVEVLDSCNGLICCRSSFPLQDPSLYVCNPLSREWIRLNWTNPDKDVCIALAFDPCKDITDRSTKFQLVSVLEFETGPEDPYFKFSIYSSDTGSWRLSQQIPRHGSHVYWMEVTFVGGILHWLTHLHKIVAFDTENEKYWLISDPAPISASLVNAVCLGESHGHLHFIMVTLAGLHIWSLEDYDKSEWSLTYSRPLDLILEEHPSLPQKSHYSWPMDPLAFKDGYLLMDSFDIYLYNIETNRMVEVLSVSELPRYDISTSGALTYSMSLVPFNSA